MLSYNPPINCMSPHGPPSGPRRPGPGGRGPVAPRAASDRASWLRSDCAKSGCALFLLYASRPRSIRPLVSSYHQALDYRNGTRARHDTPRHHASAQQHTALPVDAGNVDRVMHEARVDRSAPPEHHDARPRRLACARPGHQADQPGGKRICKLRLPLPSQLLQGSTNDRRARRQLRVPRPLSAPSLPRKLRTPSANAPLAAGTFPIAGASLVAGTPPIMCAPPCPHTLRHPRAKTQQRLHTPHRPFPHITTPGLHGSTVTGRSCRRDSGAPIDTPAMLSPCGQGRYTMAHR